MFSVRYSLPQAAIFAVFFQQALVFGSWLPRIADVKSNLSLSEGTLGLVLLALPAGTFVALSIAAPIVKRLSAARSIAVALLFWSCLFILPGAASNAITLAAALALSGLVLGFLEIASNLEADAIERRLNIRIMSQCHGYWSLGAMSGALLGGPFFAQHGFSVVQQFLYLSPIAALAGIASASVLVKSSIDIVGLNNSTNRTADGEKQRIPITWPVFVLCSIPLGVMALEGSFMDWSAVFMREQLQTDASAAGYTFAVFAAVMATVRLAGDKLAARFGDANVVRVSGVLAAVGAALFATASNIPVALLGAASAGAGVAIVYPIAMSAVARLDDNHREANVAYMSIAAFSVMMIAPPIIGWVAEFSTLRIALMCLIPGAMLTALLSNHLRAR